VSSNSCWDHRGSGQKGLSTAATPERGMFYVPLTPLYPVYPGPVPHPATTRTVSGIDVVPPAVVVTLADVV